MHHERAARSAQRTRWRRWRMGRDIAGGKDRDGSLSGLAGTSCRRWQGLGRLIATIASHAEKSEAQGAKKGRFPQKSKSL